jgi:hypothetical protein
MVAYLKHDLL